MISGKIDELFNQSVILLKFLTRLVALKCARNRPLNMLSKHGIWVKFVFYKAHNPIPRGVTDGEQGCAPPPWQAKCKKWAPC